MFSSLVRQSAGHKVGLAHYCGVVFLRVRFGGAARTARLGWTVNSKTSEAVRIRMEVCGKGGLLRLGLFV